MSDSVREFSEFRYPRQMLGEQEYDGTYLSMMIGWRKISVSLVHRLKDRLISVSLFICCKAILAMSGLNEVVLVLTTRIWLLKEKK